MRLRKKVCEGQDGLTTPLRSYKLIGLAYKEIERKVEPIPSQHIA